MAGAIRVVNKRIRPPRHLLLRLLLAAWAAAWLPIPLLAASSAWAVEIKDPERMLAGIYINRRESQNIDVVKSEGEYWISLDDFAQIAGVSITRKEADAEFSTPIGKTRIGWDELGKSAGADYLSAALLAKYFNIDAQFSALDYALFLDIPWRPGSALAGTVTMQEAPEPEITPSGGALSFIRSYGEYAEELDGKMKLWNEDLALGGRLLGGTWLLGGRGQTRYDPALDRYFWNRVFPRTAVRAGTNYINLNPLLSPRQFTGMQLAYSNAGMEKYTDYSTNLSMDSMIVDSVATPLNIIRDDGPTGGIAELRINDRAVAYARVGLNGHYEFRDISRPQGTFQVIKVLLYKRDIHETPVAVLDFTMAMARQMLMAREILLRAGGGTEKLSSADNPGAEKQGSAGFAEARYGIAHWLTLEAAGQTGVDGKAESLAGARASLGRHFTLSMDAAARGEKKGYYSELSGVGEGWELSLRDVFYEQGFHFNPEQADYDHYLRSLYSLTPWLNIGLFARQSRQTGRPEDITYAKPGLAWSPSPWFSLSAIPNMDGDYRIYSQYLFSIDKRLTAMYEGRIFNAIYHSELSPRQSYLLGHDWRDDKNIGRAFATFFWTVGDGSPSAVQGGVSHNYKYPGFYLLFRWILTPGIEIGAAYHNGYNQYSNERRTSRLQANLRVDLAATSGGFTPVNNSLVNFSRGGISGAYYSQDGEKVPGAGILINGQKAPQTTIAGGGFYVGNLKPGIYIVEIDEENLPIEYTAVKRSYIVEVGASAVTRVDFQVIARYGAAGMVAWPDGVAVEGALVEAVYPNGAVAGSGYTTQFGYYRIDGLARGEYIFRVAGVGGKPLAEPFPSRTVKIEKDYLFGQDIAIPKEEGAALEGNQ